MYSVIFNSFESKNLKIYPKTEQMTQCSRGFYFANTGMAWGVGEGGRGTRNLRSLASNPQRALNVLQEMRRTNRLRGQSQAAQGPVTLGIPRKTYVYLFLGIFEIILIKYLGFWLKYLDFWASPAKMMQNHYVISSKYHFWTWNVPNWTKSLKSDMSGPAKTCFTK